MNSLHVQEQIIYKTLESTFKKNGYEALPSLKQFRQSTRNGHKSVLFSVSNGTEGQILDVHLGVRFDIIETLVQQFLNTPKHAESEINTVSASVRRFNSTLYHRFVFTDEAGLENICRQFPDFMQSKGFRFLNNFERLKTVDAAVNRKPQKPCLYMHNQIYRCFKGIAIARLLQRTDFDHLVTVYRNYLHSRWAPKKVVDDFGKLANYLHHFSFN